MGMTVQRTFTSKYGVYVIPQRIGFMFTRLKIEDAMKNVKTTTGSSPDYTQSSHKNRQIFASLIVELKLSDSLNKYFTNVFFAFCHIFFITPAESKFKLTSFDSLFKYLF